MATGGYVSKEKNRKLEKKCIRTIKGDKTSHVEGKGRTVKKITGGGL